MSERLTHRRTIEIDVGPERDGLREAHAAIEDLRQRGTTYVGSVVVRPGPIHVMSARLGIDMLRKEVVAASGEMARCPFAGSEETRFEGCRDTLPNLANLVGTTVDDSLAHSIRAAIGRQLGCYHLTSALIATAPVLVRLVRDRPAPELTCKRRMILEGFDGGSGSLGFRGVLEDTDSTGSTDELRLSFAIDLHDMALRDVAAEASRNGSACADAASHLDGLRLMAGFSRSASARLSAAEAGAGVLELALGLAAMSSQAGISIPPPSHEVAPERVQRTANTCTMWRDGGPLEKLPSGRGTGSASNQKETP
jgi:hypothetical protein